MAPLAPPSGGCQPAPEQLMRQLRELAQTVQEQREEENQYRAANANFTPKGETTMLLLAVCDKLAAQKEAMQQMNFEEHTSELDYLRQRFSTSIEAGLSTDVVQALLASRVFAPAKQEKRRSFFVCCQSEFPPQQAWWLETKKKLHSQYQVLRDGHLVSLKSSQLFPGDIVFMCSGQRCAADARILTHEENTFVEASHLSFDTVDVRACTSEATSAFSIESANVVLRDSYLVTGSLFGMVVRSPSQALIPSSACDLEDLLDDGALKLDTTLPPRLSASQCRTFFKQFCVKTKFVCKSFTVMAKLAKVQSIVLIVTQEMIDRGSIGALVAAAKKFKKPIGIIGSDCKAESLEATAKAVGLDYLDAVAADQDHVSTTFPSGQQSGSQSVVHSLVDGYSFKHGISGVSSPTASQSSLILQRETLPFEIRSRLTKIASDMSQGISTGVVIFHPSQDALAHFCQRLAEEGKPPLFGLGNLHYATCFRNFVVNNRLRRPNGTEQSRQYQSLSSTPKLEPPGSVRLSARSMSSLSYQRPTLNSARSSSTTQHLTVDPIDFPKGNHTGPKESIYLAVSLNSVGAVSDFSDCILLSSDLSYLGQALELANKLALLHVTKEDLGQGAANIPSQEAPRL